MNVICLNVGDKFRPFTHSADMDVDALAFKGMKRMEWGCFGKFGVHSALMAPPSEISGTATLELYDARAPVDESKTLSTLSPALDSLPLSP